MKQKHLAHTPYLPIQYAPGYEDPQPGLEELDEDIPSWGEITIVALVIMVVICTLLYSAFVSL